MTSPVNAIYDYAAAGPDEFSFSSGDVIAVTATDVSTSHSFTAAIADVLPSQPDGWWQGRPGAPLSSPAFLDPRLLTSRELPVGVTGGGHIFPSK